MVNRERDEQRGAAQEPRGEQRRIPRKQRRTAAGSGFLGHGTCVTVTLYKELQKDSFFK